MKYIGGKFKYGREIAKIIRSQRKSFQPIYEPFCGGLWVTQYLYPGPVIASDINKPLINLYKEILNGWEPPDYVSEDEYNELHEAWRNGDTSPIIGFAGIACSFGAKWFGGYARGDVRRNYCNESKKSLLRKFQLIKRNGVEFRYSNYCTLHPKGALIYCDPPYAGTTGYTTPWCPDTFWMRVRTWSDSNTVLISEYEAPDDFVDIWSAKKHLSLGLVTKGVERTEKLWVMRK